MNEKHRIWMEKNPLYIFRQKKGMSRLDASKIMKISGQSVYLWETTSHPPKFSSLIKIGNFMGFMSMEVLDSWRKWQKLKPKGGK